LGGKIDEVFRNVGKKKTKKATGKVMMFHGCEIRHPPLWGKQNAIALVCQGGRIRPIWRAGGGKKRLYRDP